MTDQTEPLDLAPIKERLASATPGDWQWEGIPDLTLEDQTIEGVDRFAITAFGDGDEQSIVLGSDPLGERIGVLDGDADLIIHATADIAALVAEVERLRALIELQGYMEYDAETEVVIGDVIYVSTAPPRKIR